MDIDNHSQFQKRIHALGAVAVRVMFLMISLNAFATGEKVDWLQPAIQVESLLNQALTAYEASDLKQAKTLCDDAYFSAFENIEANLEVAIRSTQGRARAAELESFFATIRKAFIAGVPAEKIKAQIAKAVAEIKSEAALLNMKKVRNP